mmetsp:Transcript_15948/g.39457  ORF Transcript_15948/g.39457 Transcript_15948/m.39457 type:complete len:483 (-) Transcript_15948:734-2182(-)
MGKPNTTERLRCTNCHTADTPLWRSGPDGPKTLCNACGVRWKKGKLVYGSGGRTALPADYLEKKAAAAKTAAAKAAAAAAAKAAASATPPATSPGTPCVPAAHPPAHKAGSGKLKGGIQKTSSDGCIATTVAKAMATSRKPITGPSVRPLSASPRLVKSPSAPSGVRVRKPNPIFSDTRRPWRSACSSPQSMPSSPREIIEDEFTGASSDLLSLGVEEEEPESDPYFAAEVDEALSRCRILPLEDVQKDSENVEHTPTKSGGVDLSPFPSAMPSKAIRAANGSHLRSVSPIPFKAVASPGEIEQEKWVRTFGTAVEDTKKKELPQAAVVTDLFEPSELPEDIRGMFKVSSGHRLSKPYKQCVQHLAKVCSLLDGIDPREYVRAFAYDQSCASASELEMAERHRLALRGFFCDPSSYREALSTFREVFVSAEMVQFCSDEFVTMLAEDVCHVIPKISRAGTKCPSSREGVRLNRGLLVPAARA